MIRSFAQENEGVGNAGRPMHPQPRMRNKIKHTSVVTTGHRSNPAFPHAMVLTASFVLSPAIGLFVTVIPRIKGFVRARSGRQNLRRT
jgi:hypothetical protein